MSRLVDAPSRSFLRSGGWVVVAALALTGLAFSVHVATLLGSRSRAIGNGRDASTYGFDLAHANIPLTDIVAAGLPKDGLPALVEPAVWTLQEADRESAGRAKFLVPSDLVVGVASGGEARAYPLRLLVWHEIVNDTLGGTAIAVTYNPLSGGAAVFRRSEPAGRVFGVSGLLYQSNLLLFDRQPAGGAESLFSQLLCRAVAGPAASGPERLEVLPATVATWGDWRRQEPATTVLAPDTRLRAQYRRDPYGAYFGSDVLRFPVHPLPPKERGPLKAPVLALQVEGRWHAFPFDAVRRHADAAGRWRTDAGGIAVDLLFRKERPETVIARPVSSPPLPTIQAFAFAWYALQAEAKDWHD